MLEEWSNSLERFSGIINISECSIFGEFIDRILDIYKRINALFLLSILGIVK